MKPKARRKKQPDQTSFNDVWFTWWVPNKGYLWVEDARPLPESAEAKGVGPYLVKNPQSTVETKKWPLRDCPELFSDFEALEPTADQILDFANRYGWLGIGELLVQGKTASVEGGEGINLWREAIREIQACFQVSEWIDTPNEAELSRRVEWEKDGVLFHWAAIGRQPVDPTPFVDKRRDKALQGLIGKAAWVQHNWVASKTFNPELLARWTRGDVLGPANAWLVQRANIHIRGKIWLGLILDLDGSRRPVIRADSLLSAIWHQFYSHLIGQSKFIRCEVCRRWMDVTSSRRHKRMHPQCSMWLRNQRRTRKGE